MGEVLPLEAWMDQNRHIIEKPTPTWEATHKICTLGVP